MQAVIQTLHNVIKTQGTTWSIPLLQPIALGVLLSAGYVFPPRDGSGRSFNCSLGWVWRLAKAQGWTFKKPYGDARKAPHNAAELGYDMMLRLCYLVKKYAIPTSLVVNADQSGECLQVSRHHGLTVADRNLWGARLMG